MAGFSSACFAYAPKRRNERHAMKITALETIQLEEFPNIL